jgi:hypothetical protein
VLDRLRAAAGVESAAIVSDLPFTPWNSFVSFVPADAPAPDEPPLTETHVVSDGYFATLESRSSQVVISVRPMPTAHRVRLL